MAGHRPANNNDVADPNAVVGALLEAVSNRSEHSDSNQIPSILPLKFQNRFELTSVLDQGNYGTVYEARDLQEPDRALVAKLQEDGAAFQKEVDYYVAARKVFDK